MMSRYGERCERSYTQRIDASPEVVFPLLCPVREAEWLDGWAYEMIHSESGVAEEGCVFRTEWHDFPESVWMISRHDPSEKVVEFVRITPGIVATRLRIDLKPAPDNGTAAHIRYTHTPISEAGAAFVEKNYSQPVFEHSMAWWEKSMNHFLATGEILRETR
ncbi:MAG: SRPBCC family protein [Acidobacteria bacterium]|nr:SRPBCC family protein [Acidobacteriota bacterium]